MFAGRFYAPRYFATRYFPDAGELVEPAYFPHRYFPQRYFADRYFPGTAPADTTVKPSYFFHGVFPARYFADRYFPGEYVQVSPEPQPPPIFTGGGVGPPRFSRELQVVHARAFLRLPALQLRGQGVLLPAGVHGIPARELLLDALLQAELLATASPAAVGIITAPLALPPVQLESLVVTFTKQRKVARFSDDDELEAYYQACLELIDKG